MSSARKKLTFIAAFLAITFMGEAAASACCSVGGSQISIVKSVVCKVERTVTAAAPCV